MNDHLYDEIIEEKEYKEKKFKKLKYQKRKHILKDKFNYLLDEYFNQFGERKNKVNNFSIKKVKLYLIIEVFNTKTRFTDLEYLNIIVWKTPNAFVNKNETIGFGCERIEFQNKENFKGLYPSFKKAKDSYNPKIFRSKRNNFFIKKIQEKIEESNKEFSSFDLSFKIHIKKEELLEERKVSFIERKYQSNNKFLLDIENKETDNKTFFKQNLRKTNRGFISKNLYIVRPYKKDSWWDFPTKQMKLEKIIKKELLEENFEDYINTFNI